MKPERQHREQYNALKNLGHSKEELLAYKQAALYLIKNLHNSKCRKLMLVDGKPIIPQAS